MVLPRPVIIELERILTGKLGFEVDRWQAVEQLLVDLAAELADAPAGRPEAISGDPDDDLILACVVEARVEVLVSGDRRHLLPLGEHKGVRIVTPQALLAEMRGG